MHGILRRAAIALSCALAIPALAVPAAAQTAGHSPADLVAAGEQLRQRVTAAATAADAPLLTNAGAPLVRAAFDPAVIRAMPADAATVSKACIAIGQAFIAYNLLAQRATTNPADAEALMLKLQDEVSMGIVAGNLCLQRLFHATAITVSDVAEPQRAVFAPNLKKMRDGAAKAITSTLDIVQVPGVSPANRSAMLASVLEDAAVVAASFPADERAQLRQHAIALEPGASDADRAALAAIARAFAAPECNLLCTVAGAH